MTIGVPSPSRSGERLVAATPKTVGQLTALGYQVLVQAGAGATATYGDADYEAAGASVVPAAKVWKADIVATVNTPSEAELAKMRQGAALACIMAPQANPDLVTKLNERGLTALALDAVPRISRAQALDVLSTMSNVAGYRAVIEAAEEYGGMFAGQVTAAGKTQPATVFVIGAGVAGLAALGGAVSLGAQVRAFDVRPEVGEQIESMGATFVQAEAAQQEVSSDGYAKELTAEQERMTMQMYAKETAGADVVITTALVRGKGVRTITAEMVANMRPGSVIVDLAASGGGNCELTVPGKRVVSDNGVIILGYTDLCSRMPKHTSQLFGTNVVNLVKLLTPGKKDGQMVLDLEDPVQRGMTVTHDGEVLWPPPPVQVSAAPAAPVVEVEDPEVVAAREAKEAKARMVRNMVSSVIGAGLVVAAVALSPASFVSLFTVFVLAVVVGFYVISGVTHSLHTPLMAQTNA
ncbi:MAG: Re/Si-specific NAD(P)(+) transhydrogenase subunit alpha, partial [Micrococcales bacterium]|nr:Re/Si-specific NAD(P)(+) transhydrogenase subunit alpha [Micrococcales bacterium]